MKKYIYMPILMVFLLLAVSSCEKNAIVDGGLSNEKVNLSTYDFLKSHPRKMFDTTLLIIDKAGMKDLINGPGTFFVPDDYTIANYLAIKQAEARENDERNNFTLDSLLNYTPQMLKDSMGMYFFPKRITRNDLNSTGTEYETSTPGVKLTVSLEQRNDNYQIDGVITGRAKYIFLTKVKGEKDIIDSDYSNIDPSGDDELKDQMTVCQTTGILTNNGVVHVLSNSHIWTYKESSL